MASTAGAQKRRRRWRRLVAYPVLVQLIGSNLAGVISAVGALGYLIADRDDYKPAAVAAGAAPALARLLQSGGTPAIVAVVGNLSTGGPVCHAAIAAAGIIPLLVPLLSDASDAETRWLASQAARTLGNLASAAQEHRQAVVAAGAIPGLVRCLQAQDAAAHDATAQRPTAMQTCSATPAMRCSRAPLQQRHSSLPPPPTSLFWQPTSQALPPPAFAPPPAAASQAACAAAAPAARCAYCGEACSQSHWRQHRAECRRLQAEQAQAAAAGEGAAAAQQV